MKCIMTLCLLFVVSVAFGDELNSTPEFSYGVSMAYLIAHPEQLNGRTVILQGYLRVRGSYSALFMSKHDMEDGFTFNSIGIRNDGNERFLTEDNDRRPVLVEATFVADPKEPDLDHSLSGKLVKIRSINPMHVAAK